MRQLVQSVRNGELKVLDLPRPTIGPTEVLVATSRSLVSPGTELAIRRLAQANLLAKARARPDLVKQVLRKARTEGLRATRDAVERRLADDMPLGYSACGIALEVGEAVMGVQPGQRVATGGAGHGDLQVVKGMLAVPVPDSVTDEQASFATVGAIALHGLRLAEVGVGDRVLVVGLGLVGQLAARLAVAGGCQVAAVDLRQFTVDAALRAGIHAEIENGPGTTQRLQAFTQNLGFDAVLVTAATDSSAPVEHAIERARDRGTIIIVGDVGLELDRRPLYEKELTVRVARSYGPGRYERSYEDYGVDYPPGHIRWTEGRNLAAVLDLLAGGRLEVADLVTHTLDFDDVLDAYALLERSEPFLGIQLVYAPTGSEPPLLHPTGHVDTMSASLGTPGIGIVGAGSFAIGTLVPALHDSGLTKIVSVASASGQGARRLAEQYAVSRIASSASEVIADPDVDLVVVATPHASHAEIVTEALSAGRHVFCEKPLALTEDELDEIERAFRESASLLMVGFNRRWAPSVNTVADVLADRSGPLCIDYRVSAGPVPRGHWYEDRRQGGRLLGEVCHFIDLCRFLVDRPVTEIRALASSAPREELLLSSDLQVSMRFADGSLASILYAAGGHPATPKERIEVLGDRHTAIIDDFRILTIDGRSRRTPQDKGHRSQMAALRRALAQGTGRSIGSSAIESARLTLLAAASLRRTGPNP